MIEFAKYTNNKEFYSSLENEFKEQYPNDFRRIGDPIYSV
jgi:hypothetical protein